MQALTEIGFTEKDFQLASKIIEMVTQSNKKIAENTKLNIEIERVMGAPPQVARTIADKLASHWAGHVKEAVQENDQLIELQYKLMRLKKLVVAAGQEPAVGTKKETTGPRPDDRSGAFT